MSNSSSHVDLSPYRLADAIVRFKAYAERKWVNADIGQDLGRDLRDLAADIEELATATAAASDSTSLKTASDSLQVALRSAWVVYRDEFMNTGHSDKISLRNAIDLSLNSDDAVQTFMLEASPLASAAWNNYRSAIDGLHCALSGEGKVFFETSRLLARLLYVDSCTDFQPARRDQTVERFFDRQLALQIRQQLDRFQGCFPYDLRRFFDVSHAAMDLANSNRALRGKSQHTEYKAWFLDRINSLHKAVLNNLKSLGSNLLAFPCWIETKRELWYGGQVILRLKNRAENQHAILNTFQNQGWPTRVEVRLPNGTSENSENTRLNDARTKLNKKLQQGTIRFAGDHSGAGCTWSRVPKKSPERGRK